MTVTIDINLDTPIYQLTPRQLFEMQKEYMALQEQPKQETKVAEVPRYLNSVEDLAKFLGCGKSTIYKMKADGLLDEAISQYGKWIVFDVKAILEKFSKKNNINKRKW